MNKYIAIETTDNITHQEIMDLIKSRLGEGINACVITESWKELKETLIDEVKE
jgi:hypothetical protein